MFNKKFSGKYQNVRKPIIVNGLREIKAYHCNETIIPNAKPKVTDVKESNIKTIKEEIDTADDPLDVLDNNRDVEKAELAEQP